MDNLNQYIYNCPFIVQCEAFPLFHITADLLHICFFLNLYVGNLFQKLSFLSIQFQNPLVYVSG